VNVRAVTPILNVSDVEASIAWFEPLGWVTRHGTVKLKFSGADATDGVSGFRED
jgi:hypothetical protein